MKGYTKKTCKITVAYSFSLKRLALAPSDALRVPLTEMLLALFNVFAVLRNA